MTPAINALKKKKISHTIHEYNHDPKSASYGLEAAQKLKVSPKTVFKTLVVKLDNNELAVGIVPVEQQLSMKRLAKALKAKKATMALSEEVERSTGYVLGGVSPLGQKKRLKTVIDESAKSCESILVSAGRRGLDIELAPESLAALLNGQFFNITQLS